MLTGAVEADERPSGGSRLGDDVRAGQNRSGRERRGSAGEGERLAIEREAELRRVGGRYDDLVDRDRAALRVRERAGDGLTRCNDDRADWRAVVARRGGEIPAGR